MIKSEEELKNRIIGKQIKEISLFNIDDPMFEIRDCDRQIVDGGIQFIFDDNSLFTFGWDPEMELMNYKFNSFEMLYADKFLTVDLDNDHFWEPLKGQIITDIELHWTWYDDDNMNVIHIPDMILIKTDLGTQMMFGAFGFEVNNEEISKFNVDSEEWLVVFFDKQELNEVFQRNKLLDTSEN
jgi:hypothetical protein